MTEHAQIELIAAVVLVAMGIINAWRAEIANKVAVKAQVMAHENRAVQTTAIEEIREHTNGKYDELKRENESLKKQIRLLRARLKSKEQE